MIENKLLALAYKGLKVLGFEVWFWNGCGPSPRFLNVFGINAKFLWRKSISILPYFCGKNLATPRLRCIIAHKMLFSPSLHCKNIATGCLIFTVKMRQSFAFGALWCTGRVLRLCIHCLSTCSYWDEPKPFKVSSVLMRVSYTRKAVSLGDMNQDNRTTMIVHTI